ncbi:MAG: hypothetical protein MJ102_03030 [Clostridia bacterium]|nr:hypothetical protein [Clostridia bacterium]
MKKISFLLAVLMVISCFAISCGVAGVGSDSSLADNSSENIKDQPDDSAVPSDSLTTSDSSDGTTDSSVPDSQSESETLNDETSAEDSTAIDSDTTSDIDSTSAESDTTSSPDSSVAPETTKTPDTTKTPETTKVPDTTKAPETTKASDPSDEPSSLKGKKVAFIGNSFIYYGGIVETGGQKSTDKGWFYQICKANNESCTVYDFTWGGITLEDIYNKYLKGNTYSGFDYVVFSEAGQNNSAVIKDLNNVAKCFSGSPQLVYLNHSYSVYKNHTSILNSLSTMKKQGIIVVDWGQLVYDVANKKATVPGSSLTYNKNSFIKNNGDTYHPNPLAGYIAAQMTYCALTGKSAVGQMPNVYSIGNSIKYGSSVTGYSAYIKKHYNSASDSNLEAVFESAADIKGLQTLMDQYIAKWKINTCQHKYDGGKVTTTATEYMEGIKTYTCTLCGETKTEVIPKLSKRVNVADGASVLAYSASTNPISESAAKNLTDGVIGNNVEGKFDGKWTTAGSADSYNGKAPANENKVSLNLKAGGTADYYYIIELTLKKPSTVNGFTLYQHGYKTVVMDRGYDILVSEDGKKWTKVFSGDEAFLFSGVNDGKGYENYKNVTTGDGSAADLPAYTSADFDAVANVKYVAYGCTSYRNMNGYYTARLTELEVYGN